MDHDTGRFVRPIKAQYFLSFAVMGSLMPFLSVFLKERGLSRIQIGTVTAVSGLAVLFTPVIAALLADTRWSGRRLLIGVYTASGVLLVALVSMRGGFWVMLTLLPLHYLAFAPTNALQDGVYFLTRSRLTADGRPFTPYHHVRVWGTIGFMAPTVLLFAFLRAGASTDLVITCGVLFCVLGLLNALSLPHLDVVASSSSTAPPKPVTGKLPTLLAARALLKPPLLGFCIAMGLAHMANAAYYSFYPLYLTDEVGLSHEWVGVVANVGVGLEILYVLGYGRLQGSLGFRRLIALGIACLAVRLGLLAASDSVWVAVGTQAVHGYVVLVMHVTPPVFLNRFAHDHHRHSIQGVYIMAVYGAGRVAGNYLAGVLAQESLALMFTASTGVCVVAAALAAITVKDHQPDPAHRDTT